MKHNRRRLIAFLCSLLMAISLGETSRAQEWNEQVRGSWVRTGPAQPGDVDLVSIGKIAQIVIGPNEESPVKQAATFLAADIEKITGARPPITSTPVQGKTSILLITLGGAAESLPGIIRQDELKGKWDSYQIATQPESNTVWLVGSDTMGTAFAAYTLSERLGIDPLYLWTGYRPERRTNLVLAAVNKVFASPSVKYRGLFHDDEDILPRPFDYAGIPLTTGNVPLEWYKRFFETALRLRLNMVAPYTRVYRRFEVQELASSWGLTYTSHHYDILLSNPFGFNRFKLAEKRGVTGQWDWLANRENMLKYWRAGVEENGSLSCIWPVGLRGTDDYAYPFPKGMPEAEQNKIFREVIDAQIRTATDLVPKAKGAPAFTFTLYGEMLDKFLGSGGNFDMPSNVILIWPDDNDGRIRAMPKDKGKWKHGVYYHLAYYGPVTKQNMHVIEPTRIANEFQKFLSAGANEYVLVNVSELREFVRETRMIADICWDAGSLKDTPPHPLPATPLPHVPTESREPLPPDLPSPSADRFARWFAAEYFGQAAAADATRAYEQYEQLIDRWDRQWYAGDRVVAAVSSLIKKFTGESFAPATEQTTSSLKNLLPRYEKAFEIVERARSRMSPDQQRFFFENCELPLRITGRQTQAAALLIEAMKETDLKKSWALCQEAMKPLETLETEIARTEYPPFERWYGKTFIRHEETGLNIHRPYEVLRLFLGSGGTEMLKRPRFRGDPATFLPVLESYKDPEPR